MALIVDLWLYRGRDCQEVSNCEVVINNIPLNNANKACI